MPLKYLFKNQGWVLANISQMFFEGNTHNAKLLTIQNNPNILNISLQELDNAKWINTTN